MQTVYRRRARNRKVKGATSPYHGVYLDLKGSKGKPWRASAWDATAGRVVFLGRFASETEAALAYNRHVLTLWKPFLNQVEAPPSPAPTILRRLIERQPMTPEPERPAHDAHGTFIEP